MVKYTYDDDGKLVTPTRRQRLTRSQVLAALWLPGLLLAAVLLTAFSSLGDLRWVLISLLVLATLVIHSYFDAVNHN